MLHQWFQMLYPLIEMVSFDVFIYLIFLIVLDSNVLELHKTRSYVVQSQQEAYSYVANTIRQILQPSKAHK